MSGRCDLAIVGSGAAGFSAAIAATRRNKRVVMVERGVLGGTCVNVGCIPSKALLAAAEARHAAARAAFPGILTTAGPVDLPSLLGGKDEVVSNLRRERYEDLVSDYGWELARGEAEFREGPVLRVDGRPLEADHYLVATGSRPWVPSIEGLAEAGYLTSASAMELPRVPESLVVVGANYIGLEFAQLFTRLGTKVILLEALGRIAPFEEPEISEALGSILQDEGVEVHAGAGVMRVEASGGRRLVTARINGGDGQFAADHVLVATGRKPTTEGLDLDRVGVEVGSRGEVVVDEHLRTANPRVWAAGDVTGAPQFVYVAGAHGEVVVANAFEDAGRSIDHRALPRVTFTSPNIASVGLTDEQARAQGLDCECRVVPLEYVPRAIVNRDTRGLVKMVAERGTGRIMGIHVLAPGAGEIILAAVYAVQAGMTVKDVSMSWCPYLTMSEAVKLAAQSFSTDVRRLSCCAA